MVPHVRDHDGVVSAAAHPAGEHLLRQAAEERAGEVLGADLEHGQEDLGLQFVGLSTKGRGRGHVQRELGLISEIGHPRFRIGVFGSARVVRVGPRALHA